MVYRAADDRYETTQYDRVGRSGLLLPACRSGSGTTSGSIAPSRPSAPSSAAPFDLGITHFDLANVYGPPTGSVETNYGVIHAQDFRPYRDELVIATKAGYHMG